MSAQVLKAVSVTKEFSGVRVLNGVSLELERGEIFGIIGENGAGKSTFIKIIAGIHAPSGGEIFVEGAKTEIRTPLAARRLGISLIPQEFNLVETLNVYENVFLGEEPRRGLLLDRGEMRRRCNETLARLRASVSADAGVRHLSAAQKQTVEIAKALIHRSKILIMDEPTTMLTPAEAETLFGVMRELAAGGAGILYISHKLSEIKAVCDRVLILRDGEMIETARVRDIAENEMAAKMVGRDFSRVFPKRGAHDETVVLEVEGLNDADGIVPDVSFRLRKGEILGFAGLVGAGRTELAETLVGLRRKRSGSVRVNGRPAAIDSPAAAFGLKIAYLSEDRQGKGILPDFDIPANITLVSLRKYLRRLCRLIDKRKTMAQARAYAAEFNIRAPSLSSRARQLSGGNQQKVCLAKCMDTAPEILILDEPTRGIDVGAKQEIYRFITGLANRGISCMVISSEMEELIGLCGRVLVMREGRITGELSGSEITEQAIMRLAAGLR